MPLQPHMVDTFQSAATQMCYLLNEDPNEPVNGWGSNSPPRWTQYAAKMAEHAIMIETMRQYGHPV